jgi:hypothetical protein
MMSNSHPARSTPYAAENHTSITELIKQIGRARTQDEQRTAAHALIQRHDSAPGPVATEIRHAFLFAIEERPELLAAEEISCFLAERIGPGDFARHPWEGPGHIVSFCETIYDFPYPGEVDAKQLTEHVRHLMRYALRQLERQGNMEKMFQLLQVAPTAPDMSDGELLRLRNRAHLYEMRRVRRSRRWLYGYLTFQVVLIVLIFPLLFMYAENGALQQRIEEATKLDLPEEERQFLSYTDGLYWSLITAASIGYGDITPRTDMGRAIAATLGVMGVITVGVIAGLILSWMTPRRLE